MTYMANPYILAGEFARLVQIKRGMRRPLVEHGKDITT